MTHTPRFLRAVAPLLGLVLAAACSSQDDPASPGGSTGAHAGEAGEAGAAGTAGTTGAGASGVSGASGTSGTGAVGGAAGSAGSGSSGGTSGHAGTSTGGNAGAPLCVGSVIPEPSAGLETSLQVVATDQAVFAFEQDDLYGGNAILRSLDGITFTPMTAPLPGAIFHVGATASHVYFATWNKLYEGDATLSSWHEVPIPEGTWSVGEIRTTAERVIVPLDGATPYASTGDGTWTRLGDPDTDPLTSVSFAIYDGTRAYGAGGCTGGVVVRETNQSAWAQVEGLPEWGYTDISFLPDGGVLASRAGDNPGEISMARLAAGESTWQDLPGIVTTGGIQRILSTSDAVVGTGTQGTFVSSDQGSTWTAVTGARSGSRSAAVHGDHLFVAGSFGLQSSDINDAPALVDLSLRSATPTRLEALASGPVVATKMGWFSWNSSVQRFDTLLSGDVLDTRGDDIGHVVALRTDHKLSVSGDGGATWVHGALSAPMNGELLPTLAGIAHGNAFFSSAPWEGASSCHGSEAPSTLQSVGLWRRSSTGQYQRASDGLPVVQVLCDTGEKRYPQVLQVLDVPAGILAVTDGSGAFLSTDDGLTWSDVAETTAALQATVAGQNVWISTGTGLLRSTDGGVTFTVVAIPMDATITGISRWNDHLAVAVRGASSAVWVESDTGSLDPVVGLEGITGASVRQNGTDLLVGTLGQALYRVQTCASE